MTLRFVSLKETNYTLDKLNKNNDEITIVSISLSHMINLPQEASQPVQQTTSSINRLLPKMRSRFDPEKFRRELATFQLKDNHSTSFSKATLKFCPQKAV